MRIGRTSLLARAYLLLEPDAAKPVTLCQFVGMVFIGLPFVIVLASAFLVLFSPFIGIEWLVGRWQQRHGPAPPWILTEWLRAKKRRVCPIVEFVDAAGRGGEL